MVRKTKKTRKSQRSKSGNFLSRLGRGKFIALAVFILFFGGVGVHYVNQSRAAYGYTALCGRTGYCLNDWGNGKSVQMYKYGGVANNAYVLQAVNRCNSSNNLSTATCPATSSWAGLRIYQIRDERKANACIGLNGLNDDATEESCNNTAYPGTGGANGTLFMKSQDNCPSGYYYLFNAYYSRNPSYGNHLQGKGSFSGALIWLDGDAYCWTARSF